MNFNAKPGNLKMLHDNEMGYVARCKCCSEVQMGIGNVVIHLDLGNFQRFHGTFKAIHRNNQENLLKLPNGEKIVVRTPVKNLMLSFSLEEFEQIIDLLAQAWVLMEADEMVK